MEPQDLKNKESQLLLLEIMFKIPKFIIYANVWSSVKTKVYVNSVFEIIDAETQYRHCCCFLKPYENVSLR